MHQPARLARFTRPGHFNHRGDARAALFAPVPMPARKGPLLVCQFALHGGLAANMFCHTCRRLSVWNTIIDSATCRGFSSAAITRPISSSIAVICAA